MRYPYERFLKFLVSRKVTVDETIGRYGLSSVGDFWESDCRKSIKNSAPHSVVSHLNSGDQVVTLRDGFLDWAEDEGILPLWATQREFGGSSPSRALDDAIQMFVNPGARAVTGLLLLSKATGQESVELLDSRFGLTVSEEALVIYRDIFWNTETMRDSDWGAFVENIDIREERNFIAFGLNTPSIQNVRLFLGEDDDVTPEYVLKRIMSVAYSQFEAASQQINAEAAGAMRWGEMAIRAISAMGTHKKAFGGDEAGELTPSEFQNMFSVRVETIEHVSLADLQGEVAPKTDVPDVSE